LDEEFAFVRKSVYLPLTPSAARADINAFYLQLYSAALSLWKIVLLTGCRHLLWICGSSGTSSQSAARPSLHILTGVVGGLGVLGACRRRKWPVPAPPRMAPPGECRKQDAYPLRSPAWPREHPSPPGPYSSRWLRRAFRGRCTV